MDNLFFKCWRNIVINNLIFQKLNAFTNVFNYSQIVKPKDGILRHFNCVQHLDLSTIKDYSLIKYSNLPFYLQRLVLPTALNGSIEKFELNKMAYLKTLVFGDQFDNDSILIKGILPDSIERLEFGSKFSKPIQFGDQYKGLKSIKLGYFWNLPFNKANFNSCQIESLEFGNTFNKPMDQLPSTLKELKLGHDFNSTIHEIPDGILKLVFGFNYTQDFKTLLSNSTSLEHLEFSTKFNRKFEKGTLPNSLKVLKLGICYNSEISVGVLPSGLKVLKLGKNYNCKIEKGVLPDLLEELILDFECTTTDVLQIDSLPSQLKKLVLPTGFNHPLLPNQIPDSIKSSNIPYTYHHALLPNTFPSSIEKLNISSTLPNATKLQGLFKEGLKELQISSFNRMESKQNDGIKYGDTELLIGDLPSTLLKLKLGRFYQKLKVGLLPNSIEELEIGNGYLHDITRELLPISLKSLTLCSCIGFSKVISDFTFPYGLETLALMNLPNNPVLNLSNMHSLTNLSLNFERISDTNPKELISNLKLPKSLLSFEFISNSFRSYTTEIIVDHITGNERYENINVSLNGMLFACTNLKKLIYNSNIIIDSNDLPSSIEYLEFGSHVGYLNWPEFIIPNGVKELNLFHIYPSEDIKIPNTVETLSINTRYISKFLITDSSSISKLNIRYSSCLVNLIPININIENVKINFIYYEDDDFY